MLEREEFESLCAEAGGVSNSEALLDFLHHNGTVFYRPGLFGGRIVLDQNWALEAIYAIFDRKKILPMLRGYGRFNRADLEALIWWDHTANEPEYTLAEQKVFLGMMESCGICFRVRELPRTSQEGGENDEEEWEYVAPDLLPEWSDAQELLLGRLRDDPPDAEATASYDFLHEGILRGYLSKLGEHAKDAAILHNDVVRSDIHSTDSFGFSEAIFGVSHLLGFSYAPRLKNLKRQRLYAFKSRRDIDRSAWKIKPTGYIDAELIEQNWDDILRLIATIMLKETTASEIFRRLNSYSQQHALYRALKAFGKIIKSTFILRYIDEVELRKAIERQLNKIEHAHRFTRAVSVGNPREFIQAEKQEQEIAEGCKRLIKNCITCWNYLYLSQKLAETDDLERREALLQAIANGSVVSWQHINLLGEYDFSDDKLQDSVGIKPPKLAA